MKSFLTAAVSAAALLVSGAAYAADKPAANPETTDTTSALPTPQQGVDDRAPLPGANSFTEDQVKARLEDNGFTQVANLKLDDRGIWRGTAMMNNTSYEVAVDYRGNIVYGNTILNNPDTQG